MYEQKSVSQEAEITNLNMMVSVDSDWQSVPCRQGLVRIGEVIVASRLMFFYKLNFVCG